ncbi:hypothetical protein [Lactococcus sp. KTH0-1S]|uniref:hypothetical protein n=1 Tax=Lactococcus sp. KTH0-1S TaxID=3438232 RepID=UPI00403C4E8A
MFEPKLWIKPTNTKWLVEDRRKREKRKRAKIRVRRKKKRRHMKRMGKEFQKK